MSETPINQISRHYFQKNVGGVGPALWLGVSAKSSIGTTTNLATAKNFSPYILVESNGLLGYYN